ncbi:hypothetical protein N7520_006120 [Penicillium odoratum]|uniref:uncharacterized protein n=1 Tax=Penicillium odoratum TaxID=1167516 RepID=UPI0025474C2C|nr:uncharacterized protein N7520_006120 [Penicillium odoratum]KAJ5758964.1 hypothetical protein N7520_006120 [Penicillium odoratum]
MTPQMRPLGKDELFFTLRNSLGYYQNVALSISLTLRGVAEEALLPLIYTALSQVAGNHPVLFAVPVSEPCSESDPNPSAKARPEGFFQQLPFIKLSDVVSVLERNDSSLPCECKTSAETAFDVEYDHVLQLMHNTPFKERQVQWRLLIFRDAGLPAVSDADTRFKLAFVYHHALADGLSGVVFMKGLVAALAGMLSKEKQLGDVDVVFAKEEALLPPLQSWKCAATVEDASPQEQQGPANLHSKKMWLGTQPLNATPVTSRFTSFTISYQTTKALLMTVSEHKTSLTPFLQTLLTASIFHAVASDFDQVRGLCSISLRPFLEAFPEDAMGCFIGGSSTEYLRDQFYDSANGETSRDVNLTKGIDFWNEVDRTKENIVTAVNKAIKALSISEAGVGEQITMLPWVKSLINAPRIASFDINNLGKFDADGLAGCLENSKESRICLGRVVFSSSQSAIGSALKLNVITGPRGEMTVGFAWQNEVHNEQIVQSIIDKFRCELELIR